MLSVTELRSFTFMNRIFFSLSKTKNKFKCSVKANISLSGEKGRKDFLDFYCPGLVRVLGGSFWRQGRGGERIRLEIGTRILKSLFCNSATHCSSEYQSRNKDYKEF